MLADERAARAELRRAIDDLVVAEHAAGLRRPVRRIWWLALAVAVVGALVVAGVSVGAATRSVRGYTDADYRRAAAAEMRLLLSPNHTEPQQVRRILDGATGGFYDEFAQSADSYTAFVRRNGTIAGASIDGTGLSRRDGDDAVVLVAATVEYRPPGASASSDGETSADRETTTGPETNTDRGTNAAPDTRQFRLRVFVTPDDGRLKVGAVQYLP
ncbi:hypothetical protein GCM10009624_02690 [Gordonia sinesedis]